MTHPSSPQAWCSAPPSMHVNVLPSTPMDNSILTSLYLMCIIGSKHMLLVRFYLLCYGYESTFCWLTKKWSVLDVCIVTQISNLKYNRDQKTVFVTVCFCLHLGDIVRSRPRSAGALARSSVLSWITFTRHSKWRDFSQGKLLHGQVLQYIHEISFIEESLNWQCL